MNWSAWVCLEPAHYIIVLRSRSSSFIWSCLMFEPAKVAKYFPDNHNNNNNNKSLCAVMYTYYRVTFRRHVS
jgi:hypothetical protein